MEDPNSSEEGTQEKKGKAKLLLPVLLFVIGGGGGFYATYSGIILGTGGESSHASQVADDHGESSDETHKAITFVEVPAVTVNLPLGSNHKHLRLVTQLEVDPKNASDVREMMPRVIDVMNTYLRAVEPEDFEQRGILEQIRRHLLIRLEIALGENKVRDLLVAEFILN